MSKSLLVCSLIYVLILPGFIVPQNKFAKVESTKLTDNIYKLVLNDVVNVVAFLGSEGVLLVDDGFDKSPNRGYIDSPTAIKEELKKIGNENIKYIINTHTDIDHAYGNSELGQGATVIAHQLGRERLQSVAHFPKEGLPNLTFQDSLHLYFNNEDISIFYLPGHTNHDIIIHFKNAKIVCVGDLIIPDSFGSISQTGNINLMRKALDYLCNHFSDDITFVAGHERTLSKKDLIIYKKMLDETSGIILAEIKKGKEPDDMIKDNILKDWKNWNSTTAPILNTNTWIMWVYKNLTTKISAASEIEIILKTSDYKNASSKIEKVLNQKAKYYTIESELNTLGYNLMNEGKTNDAIEIFKMIVDRYPESWNAYDSLGEVYMNANNNKLSIMNYEKSLKLNPQNTNAIEQLKKLK